MWLHSIGPPEVVLPEGELLARGYTTLSPRAVTSITPHPASWEQGTASSFVRPYSSKGGNKYAPSRGLVYESQSTRRTALGQLPFAFEQAIALRGRGERKGTPRLAPFEARVFPGSARPLVVALEPFAPLPYQKRLVPILVGHDAIPMGGGGDAVEYIVHPRTDPRGAVQKSLPGIIEDRPAELPDPEPMIFFDLEGFPHRIPSEVTSLV